MSAAILRRLTLFVLSLTAAATAIAAEPNMQRDRFQVIELRRYTMKEGGRDRFIRYFESYFPAAFYYGPLWKEHRTRMNDLLVDSDNVWLLRPLSPDRGVVVLPAVDVVKEADGVHGVAVAQIFAVREKSVEAFAKQAEAAFARYRAAGVREAGVLVTLEVTNNFPQLPVRTDGPYLVWLGIATDDRTLNALRAAVGEFAPGLAR